MTPVEYNWFEGDWFQHDPCSDEARHPQWYGRSCFLRVLQAPHPQEIGFHSFSHVLLGHPGTPRSRAVQEYEACKSIAAQFNLPESAFVFPRNMPGFLDDLRRAGFLGFRTPDRRRLRV